MSFRGKAVLLTGGGSGIGRDLALALAERGCRLTVADIDFQAAQATVSQLRSSGNGAEGLARQCDVCDDDAQEGLFQAHVDAYGALDFAILNAGIFERGDFVDSEGAGWQKTLDVDLRAALVGTRLAVRAMAQLGQKKGVVLLMASAGGLFPMPVAPVYAAAKAGLVHFTRSAAGPLAERGVRLCALCPQPVDTPMVVAFRSMGVPMPETGAALLTPARVRARPEELFTQVTEASLMLMEDDSAVGMLLMVHMSGKLFTWQPSRDNLQLKSAPSTGRGMDSASPEDRRVLREWAAQAIPRRRSKVQVYRLSTSFREATRIVSEPLPADMPEGHVLIRQAYAAVNASDINYTAGRYFGTPAKATAQLPFDAGFEAVGVVALVGPGVPGVAVGDPVAYLAYGAFSEWVVAPAKHALSVPALAPEVVALLTSGLTASIGLEVAARLRSGETLLVTAAAGGTGQFAVQLAKATGARVVATCGGPAKAKLLRRLGADRVIDHTAEDVKAVLKREFPQGVDVVWESVGGDMLNIGVQALARGGRLVVIGAMSQYAAGWAPSSLSPGVPELLLWRGASLTGFFLLHHATKFAKHLARLTAAWRTGHLHVALDPTRFRGLEEVAAAVEHLHTGRSVGKVVVQLAADVPPLQKQAESRM